MELLRSRLPSGTVAPTIPPFAADPLERTAGCPENPEARGKWVSESVNETDWGGIEHDEIIVRDFQGF